MKILLIAGFLGAGKTTFIKEMAHKSHKDFVVLENEYAQTDLDVLDIEASSSIDVYEMTQGCVCCTLKKDFATSVLTIANTLDPEILVVEPTGAAKLSSLIENVSRIEYERIALLDPVCIVDGLAFERQLQRQDEILLDQLAHAQTIVVSKVENSDIEFKNAIKEKILCINPKASVVIDPYQHKDSSWFRGLLSQYMDKSKTPSSSDFELTPHEVLRDLESNKEVESPFDTLTLKEVSLESPQQLVAFLDAVSFGVFGCVLRAKGILSCGENAWLRFDVVDGLWGITGCEYGKDTNAQAVFIGKDLKRTWIREVLVPGYSKSLQDHKSQSVKDLLATRKDKISRVLKQPRSQ